MYITYRKISMLKINQFISDQGRIWDPYRDNRNEGRSVTSQATGDHSHKKAQGIYIQQPINKPKVPRANLR